MLPKRQNTENVQNAAGVNNNLHLASYMYIDYKSILLSRSSALETFWFEVRVIYSLRQRMYKKSQNKHICDNTKSCIVYFVVASYKFASTKLW